MGEINKNDPDFKRTGTEETSASGSRFFLILLSNPA